MKIINLYSNECEQMLNKIFNKKIKRYNNFKLETGYSCKSISELREEGEISVAIAYGENKAKMYAGEDAKRIEEVKAYAERNGINFYLSTVPLDVFLSWRVGAEDNHERYDCFPGCESYNEDEIYIWDIKNVFSMLCVLTDDSLLSQITKEEFCTDEHYDRVFWNNDRANISRDDAQYSDDDDVYVLLFTNGVSREDVSLLVTKSATRVVEDAEYFGTGYDISYFITKWSEISHLFKST